MTAQKAPALEREHSIPLPAGYPADAVLLTVSIPPVGPGNRDARFTEHVLENDGRRSSERVLAAARGALIVSDDMGATWRRVPIDGFADAAFVNSFTLPDGRIVLQSADAPANANARAREASGTVVVCDSDGNPNSVFRPSEIGPSHAAPWHGTSSIDHSGGVLMYAEYPGNAPAGATTRAQRRPSRVFRSTDGGSSWEIAFEVPGAEVRHFHVLRADPHEPGRWWLASGDEPAECRIWRSADDGRSWTDSTAKLGPDVHVGSSSFTRAVFRLTDIAFPDPDHMIWGTDDVLGVIDPSAPIERRGGARLFQASRQGDLALTELGYCGQAVRSLVDCGTFYVVMTQGLRLRHTTRASVHILFKDHSEPSFPLLEVDNWGRHVTPFTGSRSSRFAREGTFFTYRGPDDFVQSPVRCLRWRVELR